MKIRELFGVDSDIDIVSLTMDSRSAGPGSAFFCVTGATADGHDYALSAAKNGAACIVHARPIPDMPAGVMQVQVPDVYAALNQAAHVFHGKPSEHMTVFGVTGTNGKTTVATLLSNLRSLWHPTGYIGTIANQYNHALSNQPHTTPDAIRLHRMLQVMLDDGLTGVAMEVSSHGLVQHRVDSVDFTVAVMTNLTHEHLDYHGTMDAYLEAKSHLFRLLKPEGVAILNRDDPSCDRLAAATRARVVTYGIEHDADYRARDLDLAADGTRFVLDYGGQSFEVVTNLVAAFNISNLLAVIAALHETGIPLSSLLPRVQSLEQVEGRIERIDQGQPFQVIVDYAHTPDGFEKIMTYAQAIRGDGRVTAVFGAAGRRDTIKRPLLGRIADRYCDQILLTEEDNRDENPVTIADEIRSGIRRAETRFVPDRATAIRRALSEAAPGDVVLILAKGSETFLDRDHRSDPYDGDVAVAKQALTGMGYQGLSGEESG